jgi:hypothetical protein
MPPRTVVAGPPPAEVCRKLAVPADGSIEDMKKLRTDSPAVSDYTCILKCC